MKEDEKREFYKGLRERIKQLRMQHLFEEPCPLYEDDEDEEPDTFIGENIWIILYYYVFHL